MPLIYREREPLLQQPLGGLLSAWAACNADVARARHIRLSNSIRHGRTPNPSTHRVVTRNRLV